jgi:hypothetical protein
MNEIVAWTGTFPGFVTARSETNLVLFSPPAFTVPGTSETKGLAWAVASGPSARAPPSTDTAVHRERHDVDIAASL